MRSLLIVLGLLWVSGCRSGNPGSSGGVEDAAAIATVAPFLGSFVVAEGLNRSYQSSAMGIGLPDAMFAKKVSREELVAEAQLHGLKFLQPWFYMGTRDGWHFFALYPFADFRQIYSVPASEWAVVDPFPLTPVSSAWRKTRIVLDESLVNDQWIPRADEPIEFLEPKLEAIRFFEEAAKDRDLIEWPVAERKP